MKSIDFFHGELLTEVTREMWPFRQQIADREQVLAALALARQHRVAQANARLERAFMDGIGEVVASIDADIYHRLGLMYGYETVNSDDFLRCLLRDNPEVRVKSTSRKRGIVVPCDWRGNEVDCGLRISDCGLTEETGKRKPDTGKGDCGTLNCGLGAETSDSNGGGGAEVCTEGASLRSSELEDEDEDEDEEEGGGREDR